MRLGRGGTTPRGRGSAGGTLIRRRLGRRTRDCASACARGQTGGDRDAVSRPRRTLLRASSGGGKMSMSGEPALPNDLRQVVEHLESTYPNEGCGVLLRSNATGRWRVVPMRNAYDEYRARDPD